MGAGSNAGNANIYSGDKRKRPSKAFINCLENIQKVQQQYGLDDHYQFAVDRGDYATAQRMVDEASDNAGYTTSGYHGSRTPGFTVVDKYSWLWLARDESVANEYGTHTEVDNMGKPHNKNGVYAMRYNLGNNLVVYADGASWGELPVTEDEYPGVYADEETGDITTNAMAEWAERNGYDSITFVDVMDGGGSPTPVDVVFNPNRDAKSADPVTYDDDGNVIPLSKRYNRENNDLRYSDRDSDGNQLSAEQQKFFKDSVVRDSVGRLMVMYHGTANGGAFTVFDGDKLGDDTRTTQVGQGFYFTNVKREAEAYMKNVDIYGRSSRGKNPHLHQVYLDITKPFDINSDKLDIDKVKVSIPNILNTQ